MRFKFTAVSLFTLLTLLLFNACDNNPADSQLQDSTVLSEAAKEAAQTAWQTLSSVQTQQQLSEMVAGSGSFLSEDGSLPTTIVEIQEKSRIWQQLQYKALHAYSTNKTNGDSLIWFFEWSDSSNGTSGKQAVYYDAASGNARAYEVIYAFPARIKLEYDSTAVKVFVGPSFDDESDDRLLAVHKTSRYISGYPVESVVENVEATAWDATNEVTAANASNTVDYGGQTELERLIQTGTVNEDNSGAFSERYEYRDNTTLVKSVTFFSDSHGEFSETWRDGSIVNGTFDVLEDDNHASLTHSIQFANHPLVNRVAHTADFTLDPVDSSSSSVLSKKVYFHNGDLDTARVEGNRYLEGGFQVEELDVRTSDEGRSHFLVRHLDTHKEIEGDFVGREGRYGRFNAIEYPEGNGEFWLTVYASEQAYLNGEAPLLSLHFIYNGDGSGSGKISENGETYQVSFAPNGEMVASNNQGDRETVNAYR